MINIYNLFNRLKINYNSLENKNRIIFKLKSVVELTSHQNRSKWFKLYKFKEKNIKDKCIRCTKVLSKNYKYQGYKVQINNCKADAIYFNKNCTINRFNHFAHSQLK